jgi:hypothetical protein
VHWNVGMNSMASSSTHSFVEAALLGALDRLGNSPNVGYPERIAARIESKVDTSGHVNQECRITPASSGAPSSSAARYPSCCARRRPLTPNVEAVGLPFFRVTNFVRWHLRAWRWIRFSGYFNSVCREIRFSMPSSLGIALFLALLTADCRNARASRCYAPCSRASTAYRLSFCRVA